MYDGCGGIRCSGALDCTLDKRDSVCQENTRQGKVRERYKMRDLDGCLQRNAFLSVFFAGFD